MGASARNGLSASYFSRGDFFCFSALLEKSAPEPRLGAASSLTEIYDKLAQRACSMRVMQTRARVGTREGILDVRARAPRRFFSYPRPGIRCIPKFYKVQHGTHDLRDRVSNNFEYSPGAVIRLLA